VLNLTRDGASTRVIAAGLRVSGATVRNHTQSILRKLGVHSRLEAVAVATRRGLLP
jgi:DNA-binding NarL/FixJ family response regulator